MFRPPSAAIIRHEYCIQNMDMHMNVFFCELENYNLLYPFLATTIKCKKNLSSQVVKVAKCEFLLFDEPLLIKSSDMEIF